MLALQMGKTERPRPLDDPTRPYIKFDIVAHLDSLSSHEGKRVNPVSVVPVHVLSDCVAQATHGALY